MAAQTKMAITFRARIECIHVYGAGSKQYFTVRLLRSKKTFRGFFKTFRGFKEQLTGLRFTFPGGFTILLPP